MNKILILFFAFIFISCGDKNKDYLVNIKTKYGTMKVLLYEETPLHKKNFLELAQSGKYDSTVFHRIIEGFMIQGGDVFQKEGTIESESDRIPEEINSKFHHIKGALAAARQGDNVNPDKLSSSCQFYIVDGQPWEVLTTDMRLLNTHLSQILSDTSFSELLKQFQDFSIAQDAKGMNDLALKNKELVEERFGISLEIDPKTTNNDLYKTTDGSPHLDKGYTIFGRVVEGLEVIDKIAEVKVAASDRPVNDIYITMEVEKMSKKEINEKYGYAYPKK